MTEAFQGHSQTSTDRMLRDAQAALRFAHTLNHYNTLQSILSRRSHYDPNQPRVPAGHPDGGQWSKMAFGSTARTSEDRPWTRAAAIRGGPPRIPTKRPPTSGERTSVMREIAKWLRENAGQAIEGVAWLDEFFATIESYLDPPKTLDELQQGVATPKKGYDIHHIVEQTSAEKDGFPRSVIDAPENLVRIPRMKHWEINAWYGRRHEDFRGLSPRDYLRGKSWNERGRVGLDALIEHGVLKP